VGMSTRITFHYFHPHLVGGIILNGNLSQVIKLSCHWEIYASEGATSSQSISNNLYRVTYIKNVTKRNTYEH